MDNGLNRGLLGFRHLEMIWRTQEIIWDTQLCFVFLNFLSCVTTFLRVQNSIDVQCMSPWSAVLWFRNLANDTAYFKI